MEKKREASVKKLIFLPAGILTGAAVVAAALFFSAGGAAPEDSRPAGGLGYEANVILDDAKGLQDAVDGMIAAVKEGQMALDMKVEAVSGDGENFSCYLSNAASNGYDMYMTLLLDETGEEIYRSGLIQPGARIESFKTERKLEEGSYEATLIYNQVETDGETLHAQVNVGLRLIVSAH